MEAAAENDGTPIADNGGTNPTPVPAKVYLWVTSAAYTGNLGGAASDGLLPDGVAGANTKCEGQASGAGLPDAAAEYTHQAVIASQDPVSLNITFHPRTIIATDDTRDVYRSDDSTKIANSYADFLDASMDLDASVTDDSAEYWTGLGAADSIVALTVFQIGISCQSWIAAGASFKGHIGDSSQTGTGKLTGTQRNCSTSRRLLCVSY